MFKCSSRSRCNYVQVVISARTVFVGVCVCVAGFDWHLNFTFQVPLVSNLDDPDYCFYSVLWIIHSTNFVLAGHFDNLILLDRLWLWFCYLQEVGSTVSCLWVIQYFLAFIFWTSITFQVRGAATFIIQDTVLTIIVGVPQLWLEVASPSPRPHYRAHLQDYFTVSWIIQDTVYHWRLIALQSRTSSSLSGVSHRVVSIKVLGSSLSTLRRGGFAPSHYTFPFTFALQDRFLPQPPTDWV